MDSTAEVKQLPSHPSIEELFNAMSMQPPNPPVDEKELTSASIERTRESYFVPKQLQNMFNSLPQEQKDRYRWYGEEYYSRVIDQASYDIEIRAKELRSAVKSGLPFSELTDDEKMIVRKIFGPEWYKEIGMNSEDD